MRRVLLATFGSLGDLHPYIAVGQALRRRGIAARLAGPADYRAAVEGAGLEFAPLRPDLGTLGPREDVARLLFDRWRGTERLIRDCVMPYLREAHADLRAASGDVDVFVSHPLTHALPVLAYQQGKPWLSSVLAPMNIVSRHDPPTIAGLDILRMAHRLGPRAFEFTMNLSRDVLRRWEQPLMEFRREQGLPPTDAIMTFEGQFSPHGTLALFDGALTAPQPDWPARVHVCGAALHDGSPHNGADPARAAALREFLDAGDPPLVFALGSAAVLIAKDYWPQAIAAAQALGRRAVLVAGSATLPPLPPGIAAFDYVGYSQLFPHAAAVIHQAGIGTLSQALRAGRPQLITPVAFDQPDNARRAVQLGVARVLPFQRVRADRLVRELEPLLRDAAYADAARRVARQLEGVDGADVAAERIAELL
jgi:UDP:flavonoid glycosyltransferase YjiC (YdhE family)